MNINDDQILKLFYPGPKGLDTKKVKKMLEGDIELSSYLEYLNNRFKDSDSTEETLKRIKLGIEEKPKCPECGKPVVWVGKPSLMYRAYCSVSCRAKHNVYNNWVLGQRKYNLKKYGVEHNFQIDYIKDKRIDTLLEKYGTNNPISNPEIKLKSICTLIKNIYGKDFNTDHLIDEINDFLIESELIDTYTEDLDTLYSKLYALRISSEEVQQKNYNTHKKNNSFNTSKPEDLIFDAICNIYPDSKRQYKEERYPYHCDYYIPSLDLFIEYQGHLGHGFHPFDNDNPEDIGLIQNWINRSKEIKEKSGRKFTKFDSFINTWMVSDPKKRITAKENNLNFIELWPNMDIDDIFFEIFKYDKNIDLDKLYSKLYAIRISREDVQSRRRKSLKEKYNTDDISLIYKQSFEDKYNMDVSEYLRQSEIQQKAYNTKKKNHSFNQSNDEDRIYELIHNVYHDTIRQYKENRYPYHCDYYIPSLDLFIEYQGNPAHGNHPYDPTNPDDFELVNRWILRNEEIKENKKVKKTRLDSFIDGWTIKDPEKRKIAKENNLNFIEIWPDWSDDRILDEISKFL